MVVEEAHGAAAVAAALGAEAVEVSPAAGQVGVGNENFKSAEREN